MIQLALAIAGGNTALLILSPETAATSKVLYEIAKESVDSYTCAVVNPGSREEFMKLVQDFGNREFQGIVVQSSEVLFTTATRSTYWSRDYFYACNASCYHSHQEC